MAFTEYNTQHNALVRRLLAERLTRGKGYDQSVNDQTLSEQWARGAIRNLRGKWNMDLFTAANYGDNLPSILKQDIIQAAQSIEGWKEIGDPWVIFGTSFCRADSKEIIQMAMLWLFYESHRNELDSKNNQVAYFIDPNGHTTQELFAAMTADLRFAPGELNAIQLHPIGELNSYSHQLAADGLLPPSFYLAPSIEELKRLNINEEVKQLFIQAALSPQVKTMGDWRIQLDQLSIQRLLQKLGLPPSAINVMSTGNIHNVSPDISLLSLANEVKGAWSQYKGSFDANSSNQNESELNQPLPIILRLITKNGERIGIDVNFQPRTLGENQQSLSHEPELRQICESLKFMSLQQSMNAFPIQLSGIGYYTGFSLMAGAHDINRRPKSCFALDDYEKWSGPLIACMKMRQNNDLSPICMPKGLVGVTTPDHQITFDSPPDMITMASLGDEAYEKLRLMIGTLVEVMETNDMASKVGIVIDPDSGQVVEASFIANAPTSLGLIQKNEFSSNGIYDVRGLSLMDARKMIRYLQIFDTGKLNQLFFSFPKSERNDLMGRKKLLVRIQKLFGIDLNGSAELQKIYSTLHDVQQLGERLSLEADEQLSEKDKLKYWRNRIIVQANLLIQSNYPIPQIPEFENWRQAKAFVPKIVHSMREKAMDNLNDEVVLERNTLFKNRFDTITLYESRLSMFNQIQTCISFLVNMSEQNADKRANNIGRLIIQGGEVIDNLSKLVSQLGIELDIKSVRPELITDTLRKLEEKKRQLMGELETIFSAISQSSPNKLKLFKPNGRIDNEANRLVTSKKNEISEQSITADIDFLKKILYDEYTKVFNHVCNLLQLDSRKTNPGRLVDQYSNSANSEIRVYLEVLSESPDSIMRNLLSITKLADRKNILLQKIAGYKTSYLMSQIGGEWMQMNDKTGIGDAVRRKQEIEEEVHTSVIVVRDRLLQRMEQLRPEFMADYAQMRSNFISSLTQTGFPL